MHRRIVVQAGIVLLILPQSVFSADQNEADVVEALDAYAAACESIETFDVAMSVTTRVVSRR